MRAPPRGRRSRTAERRLLTLEAIEALSPRRPEEPAWVALACSSRTSRAAELIDWGWISDNFWEDIWPAFQGHVFLSFVSVAIALAISLPIGDLRLPRTAVPTRPVTFVTGVAVRDPEPRHVRDSHLHRRRPWAAMPVIIALVAYSLLILIRNTVAGLDAVPAETIDAARGMGLTNGQILFRVELPLGAAGDRGWHPDRDRYDHRHRHHRRLHRRRGPGGTSSSTASPATSRPWSSPARSLATLVGSRRGPELAGLGAVPEAVGAGEEGVAWASFCAPSRHRSSPNLLLQHVELSALALCYGSRHSHAGGAPVEKLAHRADHRDQPR